MKKLLSNGNSNAKTKKNNRLIMKKIVWSDGKNVFVIRKGKTSNDKISDGSELIQTYTF